MSDSEVPVELITKDITGPDTEGSIKKLLQKFNENKKLSFGIIVLIGLLIGYYLYKKNKLTQVDNKSKQDIKQDELKPEEKIEEKSNEEILILQKQLEQQQMFSQQLLQQQQMIAQQLLIMEQELKQQQNMPNKQQQNMPKIYHPNDDIDLKKVQSKEKPEINQHNLTNSEIAEIHKQLDNYKE